MKLALLILAGLELVACKSSTPGDHAPDVDAAVDPDPDAATALDASIDGADPVAGFGTLSGAGCGAILDADLTGPTPKLYRADFDFTRAYVDPDDRPLLTPGGAYMAMTPNLGGSSGISEVFAFEQLARCEGATLLKTEAEIVYDTNSKKTDLEIELRGHKIGVSVTRAFAFPLGSTYTLAQAQTLIHKKLTDIPLSTASVSAADKWDKQFLAIEGIDQASSDTMAQAWAMEDAAAKSDTIVVLVTTTGTDTFIYQNQ